MLARYLPWCGTGLGARQQSLLWISILFLIGSYLPWCATGLSARQPGWVLTENTCVHQEAFPKAVDSLRALAQSQAPRSATKTETK